ncbi:hypothetical protein JQN58_13230 [Aneurinibacillus sp. BA2021]|nr:hypothetical protein [Aneurinibacillus sp. BA2021]
MSKKSYGMNVVDSAKELFVLLENYEDTTKNAIAFTSFLKGVLRSKAKDETMPTIEMITVLKHEKPIIFQTSKVNIVEHGAL